MECTPTKKGFRRLQVISWLLMGRPVEDVSLLAGYSQRQILRYLHAFNQLGISGLVPGCSSGRPRQMHPQDLIDKVLPVVEDPSLAGQSHWTAVKLHGWIKEQLQVDLSYGTTVRYLHEQDFKLKMPRPWALNQDEEARVTFCEQLTRLHEDESVDLWFADECGIEGDPRPRRQWTKIGKVRTSPYLGEHIRHNVLGAVRPKDGRISTMLFNLCDSDTFQALLNSMAEENPEVKGRRAVLVMDNASWHKVKKLNWHHFEPMYLPPRSPDLNPIERLWLRLKADWFNGWIAKSSQELQERLITALQSLFAQPSLVKTQCTPKLSL